MTLYDRLQRTGPPRPSGMASGEKRVAICRGCGAAVEVAQAHVRVVRCAACSPVGPVVADPGDASPRFEQRRVAEVLDDGDENERAARRDDAAKHGLTGELL